MKNHFVLLVITLTFISISTTSAQCVGEQPQLAFSYDTVCNGQHTTFTNLSTGVDAGATYYLDLDNNGTIDITAPASSLPTDSSITLLNPGFSVFRAIVVNSNGCSDTLVSEVFVAEQPQLNFSFDSLVCLGQPTNITNLSTGVDSGATYFLDIANDGIIDYTIPAAGLPTDSSIIFQLSEDTVLPFSVIVENSNGCKDTFMSVLTVVDCSNPCDNDTVPPNAQCHDITFQLDSTDTYTPTEADLFTVTAGTSDNCAIASFHFTGPSSYDCTYVGNFTGVLTVTDNSGNSSTCNIQITITDSLEVCEPCITEQQIPIQEGWSIISGYINPIQPDMIDIFSEIDSMILIVKNGAGDAYLPSFGINTIGDWKVEQGYKVKSTDSTTLNMGCEQVSPSTTPIVLPVGWSIISYLRTTSQDAVAAVSNIADNLLLMKNSSGNAYIPSFDINTIGDLLPGQGYQVKMNLPDTLYYPDNSKTSPITSRYIKPLLPSHFQLPGNTGHNATVIIPVEGTSGLITGDEIGIYGKNGMVAGAAVYEGSNVAVTIWGDDPTTDRIDGLSIAEDFIYRVWRNSEQTEFNVEVSYQTGEGVYENDGISVLKKFNLIGPSASSVRIYPNPFNETLSLEFNLQEREYIRIRILDVLGKEVLETTQTELASGTSNFTLNLGYLTSGLYFCEIKSNSLSISRRIIK